MRLDDGIAFAEQEQAVNEICQMTQGLGQKVDFRRWKTTTITEHPRTTAYPLGALTIPPPTQARTPVVLGQEVGSPRATRTAR